MRLARSLLALVNGSEKWPFDKGAEMTQRTDVYTTIGHGCGCCGHRQQSVREAGRCLAKYRAEEISDRRVVAVAADAPWPPTEGCDLNAAELDALYAEAGLPAAADEHERLARFTAGIAADVAAVRRVADALHNAWAEGGPGRDTKENAEIADCRLPRHGAGARDGRAGCGFALPQGEYGVVDKAGVDVRSYRRTVSLGRAWSRQSGRTTTPCEPSTAPAAPSASTGAAGTWT